MTSTAALLRRASGVDTRDPRTTPPSLEVIRYELSRLANVEETAKRFARAYLRDTT